MVRPGHHYGAALGWTGLSSGAPPSGALLNTPSPPAPCARPDPHTLPTRPAPAPAPPPLISRAVLHIIDTDPTSLSANGWLEDTSKVEKYVMSEEDYGRRDNTYRCGGSPAQGPPAAAEGRAGRGRR